MIFQQTYAGNIWRMAVRVEGTEERIESPKCFSSNLGWLLKQASYSLSTELMAALAPVGVSPRGYHVLVAALTGEHTQTELAQMVGLDKTTMVVTIDELDKAGERKVAEGREVMARVQEEVLATLPPRERTGLLEALNRLVSDRLSEPVECSPPVRRREPR